jgi:hypothetical protein
MALSHQPNAHSGGTAAGGGTQAQPRDFILSNN